jgi:hypothetical protein
VYVEVSGSPTVVIVVVRIVVSSRYETAAFHRFLIPGDPALTIGCVIPEGAGLCQLVVDQWFCWLSASV